MIYGEDLNNVSERRGGVRWRLRRHRRAGDEVAAGWREPFLGILLLTWSHLGRSEDCRPAKIWMLHSFDDWGGFQSLDFKLALKLWGSKLLRHLYVVSVQLAQYEQFRVVNESWTGKTSCHVKLFNSVTQKTCFLCTFHKHIDKVIFH